MRSKSTLTLIVFAAGLTAGICTAQSPPPPPPTLDEVVERYIATSGGRSALARIETLKMTGRSTFNGLSHPLTIWRKRPGSWRVEMKIEGKAVIQASDGTASWQINEFRSPEPTEIRDQDDLARIDGRVVALIDRFIQHAELEGPLVDWKAKGHQLELAGRESLEGTEVYHLTLKLRNGATEDWYLNTERFTLDRRATERKHPWWGMLYPRVWYYDDYRPVAGVLFPFYWEQEDRMWVRTYEIDKIEANVPVEEALFKKPG